MISSSSLVLYADDILHYKSISCQADYAQLQLDNDAIHIRVNRCHLMLNSSKCKFLCAIRRRAPCFPAEPLLPGSEMLNKLTVNITLVSKYSANSPGLTTSSKWARKQRDWLACYTVLFVGRHSNTTEPLPYLCAFSFRVCLHSVGSLHLQEHLYARVSPKVCM